MTSLATPAAAVPETSSSPGPQGAKTGETTLPREDQGSKSAAMEGGAGAGDVGGEGPTSAAAQTDKTDEGSRTAPTDKTGQAGATEPAVEADAAGESVGGDGAAKKEAEGGPAKEGAGGGEAKESGGDEAAAAGGAGATTGGSTGTDAEAAASSLDRLKAKLPEIFKEAGVDGQTASIWGVTLDPASSSTGQSTVLQKFLDAREGDVDAAATQLASTLKWRKAFNPEAAAKESFPAGVFGDLGVILPGRAKSGEPVTLNLYGEVKDTQAVFGDLDRFLRWRVGLMERGVALLKFDGTGPSTMIQVHDYQGVSVFSRDAASKKAASEASKLFSDHYPELLSRKFFVNVPGWAAFIFKLFSNFLSARTLSKFSVLGSNRDELHRELGQVMDDSVLPERYGGTGKER